MAQGAFIAAVVLFVLAGAELIFGLYVSFDTEGGALGMVPVLAHGVATALLATLGAAFLHVAGRAALWLPPLVLLVVLPTAVAAIIVAGNAGASHHRRTRDGR